MNFTGPFRRLPRLSLPLAASFTALAGLAPVAVAPVVAGDWSIESRLSERIDFYDNYRIRTESSGEVYGSETGVFADFIYKTPDSRFDFISDLVARKFAGPGKEDALDGFFPSFVTSYNKDGKRTFLDLGAFYNFQSLPAVDTLDTETAESNSTRHNFGGNIDLTRKINALNSITFANSAQTSVFDGSGTDNFSFNSALSWNRGLSKRTDSTLTSGFGLLELSDDESTDRYTYRLRADVTSRRSKRLTVRAGGGATLVNSYKTDRLGSSSSRTSSMDLGGLADLGLDYRLKTTTVSLNASYGLQPGTFGDLQTRASVALLVNKAINSRSSIAFAATAQIIDQGTSSLSVAPTYTVALTDEWSFNAGYRFTLKDSDDGTAMANNAFLSLSRDFVLLP